MKWYIRSFLAFSLISISGYLVYSHTLTGTTTNLGLEKPARGSVNWDDDINGDLDSIDAAFDAVTPAAVGNSNTSGTDANSAARADHVHSLTGTYSNTLTLSGDNTHSGQNVFGAGTTVSTFSTNGTLTLNQPLGVASGGTGASSFTDGGILFGNGTSTLGVTGVLTNGQLLIGDGTEEPTAAVLTSTSSNRIIITNAAGSISLTTQQDIHSAADVTFNSLTLTTDLSVANGGTGASTFTDGGILFGNGTGAIGATGVLTNGQLLIGDGTEEPTAAALTGTANQVTVTNGAGSITLSLPQSINTSAVPTFGSLTLSQGITASSGSIGGTVITSTGLITFPAGYSPQLNDEASDKGYVDSSVPGLSGWNDAGTSVILNTITDNVGIGTIIATVKLDVVGNVNTSAAYQINGSSIVGIPGTDNTFVGLNAGNVNSGIDNTFIGSGAGDVNTTGNDNTFIGFSAGGANITASGNTFVGERAGFLTTGAQNTAIGFEAGAPNTGGSPVGSKNTFLGYEARNADSTELYNAAAIGYQAVVAVSSAMVLGAVGANAVNIGIGTTSPVAKLEISSNVYINNSGSCLVMKSPDGTCYCLSIANGGTTSVNSVTCP